MHVTDLRRPAIDGPDEYRAEQAAKADERSRPKSQRHGRLGEGGTGVVVDDGAEAGDGEIEAEGEGELLALEPLSEESGLGDGEVLPSHSEQDSAQEHHRPGAGGGAEGEEGLAGENERGEDEHAERSAEPIHEETSEEREEHVGNGVDGVEEGEVRLKWCRIICSLHPGLELVVERSRIVIL